jgi:hypothetical protein
MSTSRDLAPPVIVDRERLAVLADKLISGGAGLPSASEADVHGVWIDRVLAVRPDLVETVTTVTGRAGETTTDLDALREQDPVTFDTFSYAIAGAYLMNPRVRGLLGMPGDAPKRNPAFPDESEHYLSDGILDPVLQRGPIYRPTP